MAQFFTNGSGFIDQKRISKNQKFNFTDKMYKVRKKFYETKFFTSKKSKNLLMTIFT